MFLAGDVTWDLILRLKCYHTTKSMVCGFVILIGEHNCYTVNTITFVAPMRHMFIICNTFQKMYSMTDLFMACLIAKYFNAFDLFYVAENVFIFNLTDTAI